MITSEMQLLPYIAFSSNNTINNGSTTSKPSEPYNAWSFPTFRIYSVSQGHPVGALLVFSSNDQLWGSPPLCTVGSFPWGKTTGTWSWLVPTWRMHASTLRYVMRCVRRPACRMIRIKDLTRMWMVTRCLDLSQYSPRGLEKKTEKPLNACT